MTAEFGMMAAFMAAVMWSVGVNRYAELAQRYSPASINFNRAIITIPFFALAALLTHGYGGLVLKIHAITQDEWFWIFLSSLGSYAFADIMFVWAARHLGAARSLAISSTYPIWSAVAAWFFKGEALTAIAGLGLLIVVIATTVLILSKKQDQKSLKSFERYYLGVFLALFTSFLWGLNTYFINIVGHIDLSLLSLFRMGIAFLLLPILNRLFGFRGLLFSLKDYKHSSFIIFLEAFFGAYFYSYGLSRAPLAIGSALASLSPVLAVPIALVFHNEKLSRVAVSSVFAVVIGLWLLIFGR